MRQEHQGLPQGSVGVWLGRPRTLCAAEGLVSREEGSQDQVRQPGWSRMGLRATSVPGAPQNADSGALRDCGNGGLRPEPQD